LKTARESVLQASTGVTDITGSVTEQSKGSAELAHYVEEVAKMAQQNSGASAQTRQAAKGLETLVHSLESAVSRFSTRDIQSDHFNHQLTTEGESYEFNHLSTTKGEGYEDVPRSYRNPYIDHRNLGDGTRPGA
jgi:hypothetical protein